MDSDLRWFEMLVDVLGVPFSDAIGPLPDGVGTRIEVRGVGGNTLEANIQTAPIPEPSTAFLLALGLARLAVMRQMGLCGRWW
jgi:hypothetical protein